MWFLGDCIWGKWKPPLKDSNRNKQEWIIFLFYIRFILKTHILFIKSIICLSKWNSRCFAVVQPKNIQDSWEYSETPVYLENMYHIDWEGIWTKSASAVHSKFGLIEQKRRELKCFSEVELTKFIHVYLLELKLGIPT